MRQLSVTLLLLLSVFVAEAARNLIPEALRDSTKFGDKCYVVSAANGVTGRKLTPGLLPFKFQQGDTIVINDILKAKDSGGALNEDHAIVILSPEKEEYALVGISKLEKLDLRPQHVKDLEAEELLQKEKGEAAVATMKDWLRGDNSYPFSAPYTLLVVLVSCIAARIILGYARRMIAAGKNASPLTYSAAILLTAALILQFELFHNGELALSDWIRDGYNSTSGTLWFLIRFIGKGIAMFIMSVWQVSLMLTALRTVGMVGDGRTNYVPSALIWFISVIAMTVTVAFFPAHSLTVVYIVFAAIAADALAAIILNRRSIPAAVVTAMLYGLGGLSLALTLAMTTLLILWIMLTMLAIFVVFNITKAPTVVGELYSALGHVGTVFSDGSVRFVGGGHGNISPLDIFRLKRD